MVVTDYFNKWPEVFVIPNQEPKIVADVFVNNWVCQYGVRINLHSDQGKHFEALYIKNVRLLWEKHEQPL